MSIAFPKTKLQCSIQKLNVTTTAWNRLLKHVPESMRTLALFIDEIVKHYIKENKQHLKYKEIDMELPLEEEEKRGFDIKVFVATHSYKRPIANFLAQLDEENQFKETTHHFLVFFYRTVRTVDEIFTLTMGKAWEVVKPYRSFIFPIAVTKRLMEPGQSTVRSRDLVGSTYSKFLQYKAPHERVTESEDLDQITFSSKFFFREDASIYDLASFKKRTWCADVGLGIFRINKAFNFKFYFPLLDHLATIVRNEPTQKTDSESEVDDNIGFMFLERVCQVDVEMVHRLDDALKRGLYAIYSGHPALPLDFVHRYTDDYFASREYTFMFGSDKNPAFNIPPTSSEVMKLLHEHLWDVSEEEFRKKLFEIKVAFLRKGSHFSEPIFKFFEGEVVDKQGCHYFKIGGIWWFVRAEFFILVQQDFERLLSKCLIRQDEKAQLKRPWLPSKDLAGFTKTDFEKTTQERLETVSGQLKRKSRGSVSTNDSSSLPKKKSKKKPSPLEENEILSQTKKGKFVITESLPMDLDLPEPVVGFLEERRKLYKQVAKEAVYNKGYLGTDNFIVADTITAPSQRIHIELFDLMQITSTHIYLYHVKEGFSQKTRDACSQIRVAAKALKRVKGTHLSKNILEGFWQDAVESDFSSYKKDEEREYREAVKKSLLKLGSDQASAKKAFFDLFLDGKRKVCFVYAFVDNAVTERKLADETTRILRFEEKDFEKLKNPKGVYAQLHSIDVLKEGQLDRSFLVKDPYFETSKMDADVKAQVLEIFRKKMSAFESNIAKIELLHLEKELVHNLGFEFKICQIYRPPGSGATVFSKLPDFLELDLFPPEIHVSRTFHCGEQGFEILKTLGDGACALHALLGSDVRGTVQYEDHLDCGVHVKTEFVKRLKAQKDDPRIKALLEDLLIWMLDEGLKKKSVYDNIVAVIKKGPIDLKAIESQRKKTEKTKQKIEEDIAKRLRRCLKVKIPDYRTKLLGILEIREEDLALFVADLKKVFSTCEGRRDSLFALFDEYGGRRSDNLFERDDFEILRYAKRDILYLVEKRGSVDQSYRNFRLERLMKPEFLAHYFKSLLSLDYYHYTDELHMAAILFGKTAHLFHKDLGGVIAKQVFNDGAATPVLIHHKGMHFSRSLAKVVADPAPAVVVEEDFHNDSAEMELDPLSSSPDESSSQSEMPSPVASSDIRSFFQRR